MPPTRYDLYHFKVAQIIFWGTHSICDVIGKYAWVISWWVTGSSNTGMLPILITKGNAKLQFEVDENEVLHFPTYIGFQANALICLHKGHVTYFLFLTWPRTSLLFASTQVEEGWWEGVLNGKTGMFPSNFIKELSGESDELGISQDEQLSKSSKEVYWAGEGETTRLWPSLPYERLFCARGLWQKLVGILLARVPCPLWFSNLITV